MSWRQIRVATYVRLRRIRLADVFGALLVLSIGAFLIGLQQNRNAEVGRAIEASGGRAHRNHANQIYHVAINDRRIVDQTLENVAKVPTLESLSLSRSTLGSGQAKYFAKMKSLRSLALYDTNVSSYELAYVGQCRNLEVLSLDGTPIGSAGIRSLAQLDTLRYLSLARTDIGNEAVESLSNLKRLIELDLRRTEMSPRALARLRKNLPDCKITADLSPKPTMRDWIALRRWLRRHRYAMAANGQSI